jgi:EAL domain-containing protein (putative c-di-GMP-specific phosphodiesterase class I)/ActR/RegA family two-component response regulator
MGSKKRASRLLVIDDEPDVCEFVKNVAEGLGFAASAAVTREEIAVSLDSPRADVIVLDLVMPDFDGIEVLRHLGEQQSPARIILISGFDQRVLNSARRLGEAYGLRMEGVLEKPIAVADLERFLRRVLDVGASLSPEQVREAIENDQLVVHYQPKVRLKNGAGSADLDPQSSMPVIRVTSGDWPVEGVEALVRWQHPQHGLLPPADFLPIVEENGLMGQLTWSVLDKTLAQIALWRRAGFRPIVSINLAASLLDDSGLPDQIAHFVKQRGVDCPQLILEITESGAMADAAKSMAVLSRLRLKGFALSIDDFGTGYSSLVQLYRMPFSELKVDKIFVFDVATNMEAAAIVKSVINLTHNLNMSACAEGVADQTPLELLQAAGADKAQGYHFSHPVPADKLNNLLGISL